MLRIFFRPKTNPNASAGFEPANSGTRGQHAMDGGNEQRVAIKFCFKAGLYARETLVLVQKSYGNEAVRK
jgi:hypothetical protein